MHGKRFFMSIASLLWKLFPLRVTDTDSVKKEIWWSHLPKDVGFNPRNSLAIPVILHGGKPSWPAFLLSRKKFTETWLVRFLTQTLGSGAKFPTPPTLTSSHSLNSSALVKSISLLFKKGIQDIIKEGKLRYDVSKITQVFLSGGRKIHTVYSLKVQRCKITNFCSLQKVFQENI